ncbi:E3 ubiquitin-protein ligase ATL31-like [Silene latifolia]|uniref:E3 ubiquitin-protein ligase ATL31-like n=1 Tax=Silene latifolia TaxID=37657 RepID=UPI003D77B88D
MGSNKTATIQALLLFLILTSTIEAQKPSDDSSSDGGRASREGPIGVSPSMAVLIVVLILGLFIISVYVQHCVGSSSWSTSLINTATRGIHASNKTIHGLDQSVLDTFPVFPYSAVKELKIGKGALECAVCLCEFEDDEMLRFLPKCDHVYHAECIDTWLAGHTTCPVCRDDLLVVVSSTSDPDNRLSDSELSTTPNSSSEVRITINNENNDTTSLPKKFPRAHSTGHSLIQLGENCERYTLRLPVEVRRELLAQTKLKRATSLMSIPRQTSSRRGYRSGDDGSGSSRYGRVFGRSFLMRVASFRSTVKNGVDGDLTARG